MAMRVRWCEVPGFEGGQRAVVRNDKPSHGHNDRNTGSRKVATSNHNVYKILTHQQMFKSFVDTRAVT
jgi:hypothetical protein